MIRSPTGTGKTKQYMLLVAGLRRDNTPQFTNRTHTIIFTANASLAAQAFSEFIIDLQETVTLVTEHTIDMKGLSSKPALRIKTKRPNVAKPETSIINLLQVEPCTQYTETGMTRKF